MKVTLRDLRTVIGWLPARERWRWLGARAGRRPRGARSKPPARSRCSGCCASSSIPSRCERRRWCRDCGAMWPTTTIRALVVALLALGVGVFYVLRAAFLSWAEWLRQGTVYRSSAVAAERLLARYLAADYLFHARRRSASLIEPMTRASDIAYELVAGSAVNILAEAVIIAALALVLLVSAPPITLVTVAIVLGLVLVPIVMTRRSWERIGESERQLYQQQLHLLQQSLGAIKDVKVTGRQPFFEERFRHVKRELGAHQAAARVGGDAGAARRRSHAHPQHAAGRVPGDAAGRVRQPAPCRCSRCLPTPASASCRRPTASC